MILRFGMMITFVTGNDQKWESATTLLAPLGVALVRATYALPEIQSLSVQEVAAEAARLACGKVNGPVMVTDAGYYFEGLGGFPGPFVKYMNQTLTAEDFLRLMQGKTNRRVTIREALAYCEPEGEPVVFVSEQRATVAVEAGLGATTMDRILVLEGFEQVVGECDEADVRAFWCKHLTHYVQLGEWLASR